MDEDLRERIALFHYGVIGDLVSRTMAPEEKERRLAEISAQDWEIPGTPRRQIGRSTARNWIAQYEAHGFEGLKPIPRKDAGLSRGIPDEIQDLLLRLREEYPQAPMTRLVRTRHLELVCATLQVILIHSRPRQPRGRGKIERFFRTVRSAFLPLLDAAHLQDLSALNRVFWAWLEGEYHVSPHSGLDGQTSLNTACSAQG